jgi:Ca2+-binding RTX toxin-like protein
LDGRDGTDDLTGGEGNDTLTGGSGADYFFYGAGTLTSTDLITDFTPGVDRIVVSAATYTALAGVVGSTINTNTNSFFGYDPGTGALTYDADGEGAGAAGVVIAVMGLATHPAQLGLDVWVGG